MLVLVYAVGRLLIYIAFDDEGKIDEFGRTRKDRFEDPRYGGRFW